MEKTFEIIYIKKNSIIVINRTYCTISYFLSELEMELQNNNFKGNILFDLLLSNGLYSKSRFITTKFINHKIDDKNIQTKEKLTPNYLKIINNFYKKNINIIESGILQSSEIDLIKKQLETV